MVARGGAAGPASRPSTAVRTRFLAAVAAAVGLGLLTGCGGGSTTDLLGLTTYPVADRHVAPDLRGHSLDGRQVSLAALDQGHITVINVWASWCGPCKGELPLLASAAKRLRSDGVRFLGLDERDISSHARAFAASKGVTYPNLVDSEGSLLEQLKLLPQDAVPSTLVLDAQGRMAARVIGAITSRELTTILKDLGERAIT